MRPKVVVLRQCFRRSVLGDCNSTVFVQFWTAVELFAPTAVLSSDKRTPIAHRTIQELLPAFQLVEHLLRETQPEAWAAFLISGHLPTCEPVPALTVAVRDYLRARQQVRSIACHLMESCL